MITDVKQRLLALVVQQTGRSADTITDAWNRNAVVEQALRNLELQFHVRNLHRDSKQFQPPNLFDALSKAVSTSHSNVDAIVRRLLSSKLVAQV